MADKLARVHSSTYQAENIQSGDRVKVTDGIVSASGSLNLDAQATSTIVKVAGTDVLTCAAGLITAAQDVTLADSKVLTLGTTSPSTTFDINLRNTGTLGARGNGAYDLRVFQVTSSDDIKFGANNANQADVVIQSPTGHKVQLQVAGADVLYCEDALITAAQDVTLADGKTLQFGTTNCATTGTAANLRNGASVYGRDSGNTADGRLMLWQSDVLTLGANAVVTYTDLDGDTGTRLRSNGTVYLTCAASLITAAQSISLADGMYQGYGTTNVATTGTERWRHGHTVHGRDSGGSNNASVLEWSSDTLFVGDSTRTTTTRLYANTAVRAYIGATAIAEFGNSATVIKPGGTPVLTCAASLITAAQDFQMAAGKDLDCYTNGGYFKPRRVRQAAIPTPDANEALIWSDSDNDKVYWVYQDADAGTVSVELA